MQKTLFFYFFLSLSFSVFSQKEVFIHLVPNVNNTNFNINTNYNGLNGKSFNIDHFDYYISDITLTHDGGNNTSLLDSSHIFIIEPDNFTISLGLLNLNAIEEIEFTMGVPSRYNTISGSNSQDISSFPLSHPLSFQSPSMYWGWSTGYMHMIIGGNIDNDNDGTPETYFELHNLGNQNQQSVSLMPIIQTNTNNNRIDVYLQCNIEQWLKNISLSSVGVLHGSNGPNQQLLNNVSTESVFTQAANAQIIDQQKTGELFYFFDNNNAVVQWKEIADAYKIQVFSNDGRLVKEKIGVHSNDLITLKNQAPGKYILKIYNKNGLPISGLNIVLF